MFIRTDNGFIMSSKIDTYCFVFFVYLNIRPKIIWIYSDCLFHLHQNKQLEKWFLWATKNSKSNITESSIKTLSGEIIEMFETINLKLTPIVDGSKCPTRKLSHLIDIVLKPFLKQTKSFKMSKRCRWRHWNNHLRGY